MSTPALTLKFPEMLAQDFPAEVPAAERVVKRVLDCIRGGDLASLAGHSPALAGYDWADYLRCSIARMVHIAAALGRRGINGGRALDYGSYFGNVSLMLADR